MKHIISLVITILFFPSYGMDIKKLVNPAAFSVGNYEKDKNKGLVCLWEDCRRIAFTFDDLDSHIRKDHLMGLYKTKALCCKWQRCGVRFNESQGLSRHMTTHIVENLIMKRHNVFQLCALECD